MGGGTITEYSENFLYQGYSTNSDGTWKFPNLISLSGNINQLDSDWGFWVVSAAYVP